MAVLEKIRVKFGVLITVLIALALLSFIIDPTTLSNISNSMSSKYDVGKINGKKVRYEDFSKEVERITHIYETMNGGSLSQDEQMQQNIQNEAWQNYLNDALFFKAVAAAGLSVGESEKVALMSGNLPSPVMAQNPNFVDPQTGAFSQEAVLGFIEYMKQDESGRIEAYWDYLEQNVYAEQMYTKYGSLFTASNLQNPIDLEAAISGNNTTTDVQFVMYPLIDAPDSTITVSDAEIKAYYKAHKENYKQAESRDIEYVVFEVKPSDKDILEASGQINKVYDEFAACEAKDMKTFLLRNSDRKLDTYYYAKGELASVNKDVEDFVWSGSNGTSKVFQGGDTFYAAKVLSTKQLPASVNVQYIALQGTLAAQADSVANVLRGRNVSVEAVAATYGQNGQPLDLTQSTIVPGMEEVLETKVGGVCVCKLPNVSYVFKVLDRKDVDTRKQVAIITKNIVASNETNNTYYAKANTIAAKAQGTLEGFRTAVSEAGEYAHPVNKMLEGTSRLGSIEQTKEVTRWAFEQKKAGKVSKIISINNRYYIVAAVTGVNKEGYVPVSQAAISIRDILSYEKNAEVVAERLAAQTTSCTTLDEVAETLQLTVSNVDNVAFASYNTQGLDPKFIGALSAAPENKLCGPVAGNYGVYFFNVTARETGSFYTEDDALRATAQLNQYMLNTIIAVMGEDKITDNRVRFF